MAFECPSCNRPLYNRRRDTCEFCGVAVPEELLLSPAQQAILDKLKEYYLRRRPSSSAGVGGWLGANDAWWDADGFGGGGHGEGGDD